eukprot:CAMPEP_0172207358 /NCGR_PEP_ID=MMETSP1050-20130122/33788_1 /TAXON_ID=233186 /ORGANISM="Cryptomonas curvata, Strain CCAP979/52" /LENGTH=90 /DNA_ID=CAMNT_0012886661 /DNA_START=742 /DNA_END=1012 /DNA_ORIENTATION=-
MIQRSLLQHDNTHQSAKDAAEAEPRLRRCIQARSANASRPAHTLSRGNRRGTATTPSRVHARCSHSPLGYHTRRAAASVLRRAASMPQEG